MSLTIHHKHSPRRRGRSLSAIAWLCAGMAVLIIVLLVCYWGLYMMSAARSYVAAESMWSKAQKQAVLALTRYMNEGQLADWQSYQNSLTVITSERVARKAMEANPPDKDLAVSALLNARNHPDDVDGMLLLFRTFRWVPEVDQAVAAWGKGDFYIDHLTALGDEIRASVVANGNSHEAAREFMSRVTEHDQSLTLLEQQFSQLLGDAVRRIYFWMQVMLLAVILALMAVTFWGSQNIIRRNARYQNAWELRRLLDYAPLPILIVQRMGGLLVYVNDQAQARLGLQSLERASAHGGLIGYRALDFYTDPQENRHLAERMDADGTLQNYELELHDLNGQPFWSEMSARRISFESEDCIICALVDIDKRRSQQQDLRRRAFHDELTGLPNRTTFIDTLDILCRHSASQTGAGFFVLFIDLDGFKIINDTYGHHIGDQLLREVAKRLRECTRETDMAARLGGDEFTVLIKYGASQQDAETAARNIIATLGATFIIDGNSMCVGASIGIARHPEDGIDSESLMRQADRAMYQAKATGRNTYCMSGGQR